MKVVVTGAAGHIGTYLVPMLVDAGYDVVAITRHEPRPYEPSPAWDHVEKVLMDRSGEPAFAQRIAAKSPDVVVDLINFDISQTREMVGALSGWVFGAAVFTAVGVGLAVLRWHAARRAGQVV